MLCVLELLQLCVDNFKTTYTFHTRTLIILFTTHKSDFYRENCVTDFAHNLLLVKCVFYLMNEMIQYFKVFKMTVR